MTEAEERIKYHLMTNKKVLEKIENLEAVMFLYKDEQVAVLSSQDFLEMLCELIAKSHTHNWENKK